MTEELKYIVKRTEGQYLENLINTFLEENPQYRLYQILAERLYNGTLFNVIFELKEREG